MQVDITLKNYRCFPDSKPARISLRKDLTGFVGVNNSGKSSLLKFFYEFRDLFQLLAQPDGTYLRASLMKDQVFQFARSVLDPEEMFCNINDRDLEVELHFTTASNTAKESGLSTPERLLLTIPRGRNIWRTKLYLSGEPVDVTALERMQDKRLFLRGSQIVDLADVFQAFSSLASTLYIGAFRNAINVGTQDNYFDIQVGQAFVQAWRHYKTGSDKKANEAAYRLTEDVKHIFGFKDLEINPSPDDTTLQVFIDGRSYKLLELGSGLAQFIIVLANAATKPRAYVLIDEPELNLHPSLQLDFLTTLASYAIQGVLFATHSIGLARACADQVYSIRKIAEGESEVTPYEATPHLSEFLGELGFSGYKELGFDKVLLVEGATEVKTVQQFLRKYQKDHQIVLLSLGGGDLIKESSEAELQEIKRITDNVFAVIDSERTVPGAPLPSGREAFVEMCRNANTKCHVLERRATENYLSDRAVKLVKGPKYRAPEPYEKLSELPNGWAKAENWRIAREMTREELDETDLGEFLRSL